MNLYKDLEAIHSICPTIPRRYSHASATALTVSIQPIPPSMYSAHCFVQAQVVGSLPARHKQPNTQPLFQTRRTLRELYQDFLFPLADTGITWPLSEGSTTRQHWQQAPFYPNDKWNRIFKMVKIVIGRLEFEMSLESRIRIAPMRHSFPARSSSLYSVHSFPSQGVHASATYRQIMVLQQQLHSAVQGVKYNFVDYVQWVIPIPAFLLTQACGGDQSTFSKDFTQKLPKSWSSSLQFMRSM